MTVEEIAQRCLELQGFIVFGLWYEPVVGDVMSGPLRWAHGKGRRCTVKVIEMATAEDAIKQAKLFYDGHESDHEDYPYFAKVVCE